MDLKYDFKLQNYDFCADFYQKFIPNLSNYYFYIKNLNYFCLLQLRHLIHLHLILIQMIKISWVYSFYQPLYKMLKYFLIIFLLNFYHPYLKYFLPLFFEDKSNLSFLRVIILHLFELIFFCKEMAKELNFHHLIFLKQFLKIYNSVY